jgi:glycosyltransferase involved in cell wall biosynthesis
MPENLLPVVSVIMTSFNREDYIKEAIESVLNSGYRDFELIICDDCSKDNTVKIARHYEALDNRVRVFVNEKNLGDYPNRNKAAGYARGKYIKYLDSDDKFFDFSLEYCVGMMEANPEADWGLLNFDKGNEGLLLTPEESIMRHFFEKPFLMIGPDGSILRRDFFLKIGGYSEKYGPANDVYTNIYAASQGKMILLTREFFYYRIHEGQEMNNKYGYLYNNYLVIKDILPKLKPFFSDKQLAFLENKNKRRFLMNILKFYKKSLNLSKTRNALNKAGFTFRDSLQAIFH